MRIKSVYLPNWLFMFLFGLLVLMMYFVIDPINQAVNGFFITIFGPILEVLRQASSLSVV